MRKIVTKTKIKVPFYDLDPMNIVWHGNYVKYMEEARCDFFRKINYTYKDMYNDGVMYPIVKMDLKYIKSARFEDDLTIECVLKELEPAIVIKYNIYIGEEKILSATTMQMCVNVANGETIYNAPNKLINAIEDYSNE